MVVMAMSNWPDWQDAGRVVILEMDDGRRVSGVLFVKDEFWTGVDEVPIFRVRLMDGSDVSFADHARWSFAVPTKGR